jgi:hypothetical protein
MTPSSSPASPHRTRVTSSGAFPVVELVLSGALGVDDVDAVVAHALSLAHGLAGNRFCLLVDTRDVTGAEAGATERLAKLEEKLAPRGLVRVAHVVTSEKLAALKPKLDATYAALGAQSLVGTFDDVTAALAFLDKPVGDA